MPPTAPRQPALLHALLAACAALGLSGCASSARMAEIPRRPMLRGCDQADQRDPVRMRAIAESNRAVLADYASLDAIPDREENIGLCLSGGGIRSAMISIGVLRSLRDLGMLPRVSHISAVSGGSYAMSWYLSNVLGHADAAADRLTRTGFQRAIRELSDGSNFVSAWRLAGAAMQHAASYLILWPFFHDDHGFYHEAYAASIYNTFIERPGEAGNDRRLDAPELRRPGVPLLIYNMTIENSNSSSPIDANFEVNQRHSGNHTLGWKPVEALGSMGEPRYLAALSGAAITYGLYQDVRLDPASSAESERHELRLADGGHTENLGALALIKRGVRNLIVVDNGFDPRYEFADYFRLKDLLRSEMGLELSIPGIEASAGRIASPHDQILYLGWVGNLVVPADPPGEVQPRPIRIAYLKMAVPRNRLAAVLDRRAGPELEALLDRVVGEDQHTISAAPVQAGRAEEYALACGRVAKYAIYANNDLRWRGEQVAKFFHKRFPQNTTTDQSFDPDQSAAFISLGYLMGMELGQTSLASPTAVLPPEPEAASAAVR